VEVSRLLSRCKAADEVRGCYQGVEAAMEVSRLLLRCQGRRQGVEAAVEVSRLLLRC
jgi:hypothetical protein